MLKRTSQTKRLSGRAQRRLEMKHRADHNHAAHGGRALFGAVQFGQPMNFFRAPDRLANLQRESVYG